MKCLNCSKRASFGIEYKKATHCKDHAINNMLDVISKRCEHINCTKRPSYGFKNKKATHCKSHADDNMVDVISKQCEYPNCTTIPSYGLKNKKATHCKSHANDDMSDVSHKCCKYLDCYTRPSYGLEYKKPTHCKFHANNNMFDVSNKCCEYLNCIKRASYGLTNKKPIYCKSHANDNMFDVRSKHCEYLDCTKQPTFGLKDKKATHCDKHKLSYMFDVKHKLCKTCNSVRINLKYKPNCARCHFYLHPDDPRIRNYKIKEDAFMQSLKALYPNLILDKIISGGCSKRRPDGLLDQLTYSIIIEIDEDQHIGYETLCDNKRNMELFTDLGSRPIIFIRLNPDKYSINGKTIKGCFTNTKDGELKIAKKEFSIRFNKLQEALELAIANEIPNKEITFIKLFYTD